MLNLAVGANPIAPKFSSLYQRERVSEQPRYSLIGVFLWNTPAILYLAQKAYMLHQQLTLNCGGRLLDLSRPVLMGILNVTPDSFYDGGRYQGIDQVLSRAEQLLTEGATILDVGGMSSRPGADVIGEAEERQRVIPALEALVKAFPDAIFSVDTVRSGVARAAVQAGATVINDISAGSLDRDMYVTVAELGVPYILMHMRGRPETMQDQPHYDNVALEVLDFFIREVGKLRELDVKDIVLDPGFGFGKTLGHNYQLLQQLHTLQIMGLPILAGLSRKSMIYKLLGTSPAEALNGTTALHLVALQQGAKILRVHDAKEAKEVVLLWEQLNQSL